MSQHVIQVVAGVIFNQDQSSVLLSLRKPDQHQGNCWEFPGGKIEIGESHSDALARELDEELGIQIKACEAYCEIHHDYGDKQVHLFFMKVCAFAGEPIGREGQQLDWVPIARLCELDFPEANKPVVAQLVDDL